MSTARTLDRVHGELLLRVRAQSARERLADAVSAMGRLARSPDDRARELVLSQHRLRLHWHYP